MIDTETYLGLPVEVVYMFNIFNNCQWVVLVSIINATRNLKDVPK